MGTQGRIVLVEDDDIDALLFTRAVEQIAKEFQIIRFENPLPVISYLQNIRQPSECPRVIFCDMNMPLMNGVEFLNWLRASPCANVPVVMWSSGCFREEINLALRSGACAWVTKPIGYIDLVESLRVELNRYTTAQENEPRDSIARPTSKTSPSVP